MATATLPLQAPPAPRRNRERGSLGRAAKIAVMAVAAFLTLGPVIWTLWTSLTPLDSATGERPVGLAAYADVFTQVDMWLLVWNSALVTGLCAAGQMITAAMAGYVFAKMEFRGKGALFGLVLATMMLPGAVTLIPQYLIWNQLGLVGTNVPLWGANLFGSAFYIFMQRQFFLGLPRETFEASRVDGLSYWGMFWRIAMPLSVPSFVIIFLFEFQASWNNLQAALIYLNAGSPEQYTVPLGIASAMVKYSPTAGGHGDYQYVMVASLLVTLPMLVLFAFGQRYFIEGIATQGRKA